MRQPHFLALYWDPSAYGKFTPTARIMSRHHVVEDDRIFFGGICTTKGDLDVLINDLIKDLEDARQLGHQQFDAFK